MLMIPADRAPPYAGGIFALDVRFPDEYPRAPPEIKWATQIWHPNVNDATGETCGLRVLEERNWSPVVVLRHVLLDLETLMGEPDLEKAAEASKAVAYVENRIEYERMARKWTRGFAMERSGDRGNEYGEEKDVFGGEERGQKMAGLA
ncbi:UBC-like protein [Phaeosphaeriaceae sp. SRC1lsM3a]|nr:UBC-like protein [Stagonospora sp. SRC1lsM3a]